MIKIKNKNNFQNKKLKKALNGKYKPSEFKFLIIK
jgi:hypothetical protein